MSVSSPARPITVLLPPSEGKAVGGTGRGSWSPDAGAFGVELGQRRHEVVDSLVAVHGGDARMLGVTGRHLDRAQGANVTLLGASTLPAWQRYTGVVWDHLDPATIPAPVRRRILVVSGLFGVVRADDPIPDYRLKMAASLPPFGKLSTWWRPAISPLLDSYARRRTVVDLLANEHRAAIDRTIVGGRILQVTLRTRDGSPGGHGAKAAKGRLARHLLSSDDRALDALRAWHDPDFVVDVDGG